MAHARELSDGVVALTSIEAQLVAAAANEPRRPGGNPDGSNYFTTLATLAGHGRARAAQLSQATAVGATTYDATKTAAIVGKLNDLARHYAALEGACHQQNVTAVRQARQAITTVMVALHTMTPHLSGG
ncbi:MULTISPECIES: hypothetical protein [unclassified Crossiella]|uniref:hypothetical protein n=1 Tax=unclassified Crossiella TaxID=2620835 RepID=UPI001FFF4D5A|nr:MULTISPECIES: hypothetical protein [unclassified Crossiella]MCK2240918.1 hypothetical protein [Crossiella sp. S99.2]MCK2253938.1 hypothetical protein [Crossiella sp. S99.1]